MAIWDLIFKNKNTDQGARKKLDKLYMDIAIRVGLMSRDKLYKVGAVLVDSSGEDIISFGYNGTPRGDNNETRKPCGTTKDSVVHAETNAICKAARRGKITEGGTIYTTISPCFECSRYIIQAGINKVVFREIYKQEAIDFLRKFIKVERIINEEIKNERR